MLGVCTAVSLTYDNEGTNELVTVGGASVIGNSLTETGASFASKSSSDFKAPSYHLQIEPGLSATSTDFANEVSPSGTLADGFTAASDFACWGTVTSNADTNPQILVKKVDVRRRKVYSKEG